MLTLKDINKDYAAGTGTVRALRGISLEFRKSEFVSILGPSGCGKTTLLNIIGGLDQYTEGDLVINGKSTKDFTDTDWDSYRNHSIGFVFQTYNLIPHQTVLSNVELALTLSGVSKAERRRRAIEALERVGLGDQIHKKPNQMSGGQMQRVAIARALVNNPDILLADEPTGALDSETSVQIMEILKEIAADKLVIMVTHNPALADEYSTRIIRLLDGKITDDTNPCISGVTEPIPKKAKKGKEKKPSMSFLTALSLSLNNLMTKKTRTFLTSFAGSIGIMGIALILSLSNGIQAYIDRVQEDTLSQYPIVIEAETLDASSMITSLMGIQAEREENMHALDAVYSNAIMYDLINTFNSAEMTTNDLHALKAFIESSEEFKEYASAIRYTYDLNLNIFTKDESGAIVRSDIEEVMMAMYGDMFGDMTMMTDSPYASFSQVKLWEEILPDANGNGVHELFTEQYELIHGAWPQAYNEVVLIVDKNNELSDLALYALGLKPMDELDDLMQDVLAQKELDSTPRRYTYEEICAKEYRLVVSPDFYQYDAASGAYIDLSQTDTGMSYLYDNSATSTPIKVVGIIRQNDDAVSGMMTGSIGYTHALSRYVMEKTAQSEIVKAQLTSHGTDVITGLPFRTADAPELTDVEKAAAFRTYMTSLSVPKQAQLYSAILSEPDAAYLEATVSTAMTDLSRADVEAMMINAYATEMGVEDTTQIEAYIRELDDETLFGYVREMIEASVREQYAQSVAASLAGMSEEQLAQILLATEYTDEQCAVFYDLHVPSNYSDSTYEKNLKLLGAVDEEHPSAISIYAATFAAKDEIARLISEYNASVPEEDQISYTDYVALIMSSVSTIINAISYVLIAFVAISLVVSSIMIGIITYISVLERTKEIGILRAIGASKKDVSRVFNAETLIVGFVAGALGIGITLLLNIPINLIIHALTDIQILNAALPFGGAVILVLISVVLTLVAGLIPARIAAKKDPVVALRSE